MKQSVVYPISTKYRPDWGDWEVIREITQNALDSGKPITMNHNEDTLEIIDHGSGFELKHLLIGETTRNGETSIGKFGEGLKFALLTLVRDGREVTIQSNNLLITPTLTKMFGEDVLEIMYDEDNEFFLGTKVLIKGIDKNFRDKFLHLDLPSCMKQETIINTPGMLYVKGIYVKEIPSICSYNIIMERENPLSGDVSSEKVKDCIFDILTYTNDKEYMLKVLNHIKDHPDDKDFEAICGPWSSWSVFTNKSLWKEAVTEVFGKKACRATSSGFSNEAEYLGYTLVYSKAFLLKGLLISDLDAIREFKAVIDKEYTLDELNLISKNNIQESLRLIKFFSYRNLPIKIVDFADKNIQGCSVYSQYLKISLESTKEMDSCLSTIIHEAIHFIHGFDEFSKAFVTTMGDIYSKIIMNLLNGGKNDTKRIS